MSTTSTWIGWMERVLAAAPPEAKRDGAAEADAVPAGGGTAPAVRGFALAAAVALGAAGCAARAGDDGPRLVNRNGDQGVVYARPSDATVVGGAYAAIAGGGDDLVYSAATGARVQEPAPVARLIGGGDNARVVYAAPPAAGTMTAARPGPPDGG